MENDNLNKIITITVPDHEISPEKIISRCKKKAKKHRFYSIMFFLFILLLVPVFTLTIFDKGNEIRKINNQIESLSLIENDELRMIEAVKTNESLLELSDRVKKKSNYEKLDEIIFTTSNSLKKVEDLNEIVNHKSSYFQIDKILNINEMIELEVDGYDYSTCQYYNKIINDQGFVSNVLEIINLPYVDIISSKYEEIYNTYKNTNIEGNHYIPYYLSYINNEMMLNTIIINPRGYVVIQSINLLDNKVTNQYISLVKINFENIKKMLEPNALNNYKKRVEEFNNSLPFINNEALNHIEWISIFENVASSSAYLIKDKMNIVSILNELNLDESWFCKRSQFSHYSRFNSLLISIAFDNGESINCYVSDKGVLTIFENESSLIYCTEENRININQIFKLLR